MSRFPIDDPECLKKQDLCVEQIVLPRTGDLGNFEVKRALPAKERRMVGPFIFLDQMGPGEFLVGQGLDVRPHPHIGLATLTYLLQGTIDHRDSLGIHQRIEPGEINWMTAGSGVVHSERTGEDVRKGTSHLFGIQSWIALPKEFEDINPSFVHHSREAMPTLDSPGVRARLVLGQMWGLRSPVVTFSDTLYADLVLSKGTSFPIEKHVEERALYPLSGRLQVGTTAYEPQQLLVLRPGEQVTLRAQEDCRVILLGGAPLEGPRHVWWNFVSSSKEKIEEAKRRWTQRAFPEVPGEDEWIPLP